MGKNVGRGLKRAEVPSPVWDIWSELNQSVKTEHLRSPVSRDKDGSAAEAGIPADPSVKRRRVEDTNLTLKEVAA